VTLLDPAHALPIKVCDAYTSTSSEVEGMTRVMIWSLSPVDARRALLAIHEAARHERDFAWFGLRCYIEMAFWKIGPDTFTRNIALGAAGNARYREAQRHPVGPWWRAVALVLFAASRRREPSDTIAR
jgi:hypothetical protein